MNASIIKAKIFILKQCGFLRMVGIISLIGFLIPSYGIIKEQVEAQPSIWSKFFTTLDAGVNGGYISGISAVYGGINGKATVYEDQGFFTELPMNFIFGNSGFYSLSGGLTAGYIIGEHTMIRGYGIYDQKKIQGDFNYPEGFIGIEGYQKIGWGIKRTSSTIHASTSFSMALASTKTKVTKQDYAINLPNKTIDGIVTYDKEYTYQDIRVGYLPGYYGIEVYLEPYVLYPTNNNFKYVQNVSTKTTIGYGGGIEDVEYLLGVKVTSKIGIRNDATTGFNMGFKIGISKQWLNRSRTNSMNAYKNRPLPYNLGGIVGYNNQETQALDKNKFINYDFAENDDDLNNLLGKVGDGLDVLIIKSGDYNLDGDFKVKNKGIVCSTYYCAFKLKNGDDVVIQRGNVTIKKGVSFIGQTRPRITFGDNNIVSLTGAGQIQGLYVKHKTEATPVQVNVEDGGGSLINNKFPTRLTLVNKGTNNPLIVTDNTFGSLTIQNVKANSTFFVTMRKNKLDGENLPTDDSLVSSEFALHGAFTHLDGHMATGVVNIITADDTLGTVTSSAKIRIAGSGNTIDIASGIQNKAIMVIEGDVAMQTKQDKIFDDITINGDIKNAPCAICVIGFTDDVNGVNIGNIIVKGSILTADSRNPDNDVLPGVFVYVGSYSFISGGKTTNHNVVMKGPLTIGDITVNKAYTILWTQVNSYNNLGEADYFGSLESAVTIGNVKVDTLSDSVFLDSFNTTSSGSIHIGNVDINTLNGYLSTFYSGKFGGSLEMGDITINHLNGFLMGIDYTSFGTGDELKSHWKFGNITIKSATFNGNFTYFCVLGSFFCVNDVQIPSEGSITIGNVSLPGSATDYTNFEYIFGFTQGGQGYSPGVGGGVIFQGKIQIGSVTSNAGTVIKVLGLSGGIGSVADGGTFSIGSGSGPAITGAPMAGYLVGGGGGGHSTENFGTVHFDIVSDASTFVTYSGHSFSDIGALKTEVFNTLHDPIAPHGPLLRLSLGNLDFKLTKTAP